MNSVTLNTKILIYKIEECNKLQKNLIEKAKAACANAYAPYSHFHVGAAMLLDNGEIVTGNNQENAAYPSGTCAERTALYYSNAQYPNNRVEAIAIAAFYNGDFTTDVCTPCGSCRQAILEIENKHNHPIQILMTSKTEVYQVASIKDLLPLSFGSEALS